jgi:hypothetical protein
VNAIKRFAYALALTLTASAAGAATLDGVTFPDKYPVAGQTLVLNGLGQRTLTVFNVKVYVAALYLPQPSHDATQILASHSPKVLLLQYLHSGSKSEIEEEYRKGEQTNCADGGCNPADKTDFERLVAAAPAVKVGDTTTYIFNGHGFQVYANNQSIGTFNNEDLAERLLSGFIGAHPPSPDLRSRLLGLAG